VFIGRISYSLFLWQQFFIFAVAPRIPTVTWAIALAFVTSYAFYMLVERKFLEIKRRDRADLENQAVVGFGSAAPAESHPRDPSPARSETAARSNAIHRREALSFGSMTAA
jgi:peptidoglycan/LPS O-acetylase OafA/YrhL